MDRKKLQGFQFAPIIRLSTNIVVGSRVVLDPRPQGQGTLDSISESHLFGLPQLVQRVAAAHENDPNGIAMLPVPLKVLRDQSRFGATLQAMSQFAGHWIVELQSSFSGSPPAMWSKQLKGLGELAKVIVMRVEHADEINPAWTSLGIKAVSWLASREGGSPVHFNMNVKKMARAAAAAKLGTFVLDLPAHLKPQAENANIQFISPTGSNSLIPLTVGSRFSPASSTDYRTSATLESRPIEAQTAA